MLIRLTLIWLFVFTGCKPGEKKEPERIPSYSLSDFYSNNLKLDRYVDSVFQRLPPKLRIAQMIIVAGGEHGKPTSTIEKLIRDRVVGGVLMLSGEKENLVKLIRRFDSLSIQYGNLPLIFSSDAEPSLFNRKIEGTQSVPKTITLKTEANCDSVARIISGELLEMGISHNYAPVVDVSPDNAAITNRTFGYDSASVVGLSAAFIKSSQEMEVAATAKHFPGHGLVRGDTHNRLVTIDGELKEVNHYIPLIEQGVISIMVGHIAVINNAEHGTNGLPASCSGNLVTDLLKKDLGFNGIVITDAMNMGALRNIKDASFMAVRAGCDMILMEPDEMKLVEDILRSYRDDLLFKSQIDNSVRKILRLKVCLNRI
ncbi:MAG: glycoside hydrolase family 3 protein [Cytophagales bacterium]|nr:glycoside hydrolase family 3 protein [Cytophagales bacterium]